MEKKFEQNNDVIEDNKIIDLEDTLFYDAQILYKEDIDELLPVFKKGMEPELTVNIDEIQNTKEFNINSLKIEKKEEELELKPIAFNKKAYWNKQYLGISLSIVALLFIVIGLTYANYVSKYNNTNNQVIQTGDLEISYSSGNYITGEFLPQTNEQGLLQEGYSFTVKNTGSLPARYVVKLYNRVEGVAETSNYLAHNQLYISFDNSTPRLISTLDKEDITVVIENDIVYIVYDSGTLDVEESKSHGVKVWLKEDADSSVVNKAINIVLDVEYIVDEES